MKHIKFLLLLATILSFHGISYCQNIDKEFSDRMNDSKDLRKNIGRALDNVKDRSSSNSDYYSTPSSTNSYSNPASNYGTYSRPKPTPNPTKPSSPTPEQIRKTQSEAKVVHSQMKGMSSNTSANDKSLPFKKMEYSSNNTNKRLSGQRPAQNENSTNKIKQDIVETTKTLSKTDKNNLQQSIVNNIQKQINNKITSNPKFSSNQKIAQTLAIDQSAAILKSKDISNTIYEKSPDGIRDFIPDESSYKVIKNKVSSFFSWIGIGGKTQRDTEYIATNEPKMAEQLLGELSLMMDAAGDLDFHRAKTHQENALFIAKKFWINSSLQIFK